MELRIPVFAEARARPALTLHIDRAGDGFRVVMSGAGTLRWYKTPLGVGQRELEAFNQLLQRAVERVADDVDILSETWKDADGPLAALAEAGSYVFTHLFPDRSVQEMIVRSLKRGALVEVASEEFLLPWELLYTPVHGHGITGFWGMRCVIARLPFMRAGDEFPNFAGPAANRPVIASSRPQLGLIVSETLDSVREVEIPSFVTLHETGSIYLSRLQPLLVEDRLRSLSKFREFLGGDRDLLHLACHAEDDELAPESRLEISEAFPIRIMDLGSQGCRIRSGAFVMLNACRTGTMNPGTVFNWSSTFLQRGASGVLATEFRVLDDFAARFASYFYYFFLRGTPVGEAVLRARRYFWRRGRNPLGLGYSLYSSPDIRIQTS